VRLTQASLCSADHSGVVGGGGAAAGNGGNSPPPMTLASPLPTKACASASEAQPRSQSVMLSVTESAEMRNSWVRG
jgi:hypothetical protein